MTVSGFDPIGSAPNRQPTSSRVQQSSRRRARQLAKTLRAHRFGSGRSWCSWRAVSVRRRPATTARPPTVSTAAATCTSKCVSTPPITPPVLSTMVMAIPSLDPKVKGWHALAGRVTRTPGLSSPGRARPHPTGECRPRACWRIESKDNPQRRQPVHEPSKARRLNRP
jgi:hypothetical protein